ncbi:sulfatase [Rubritalea tangerina]|uniref:Sulfatase n=1 Tax=Rubritalea tangerina TaxID=430798 RepID=A0ABW4ZFA7_9BACT
MFTKSLNSIALALLSTSLASLTSFASTVPDAPRPALEKPNVIIFFLDDSGYGDISHNGNPTIHTPNIDRLAQEGKYFTQFYVGTAACSASRYALLTGRVPGRSGLKSWVIGPSSPRHIHTQEITLAEGLKTAGYKTGMFGKWHLGSPNEKNNMSTDTLPLAHGFDQWVGTNVSHDYDNAQLLKSDINGNTPIKGYSRLAKDLPSDLKASESLTGRYTDAAVQFIKDNREKPFFAYVAHNQPHLGLYASKKFKGKSKRGLLGDVMAEVDDSVARVMKTLKEEGIDKNTLVIFSSDNGPWLLFRNTVDHRKYGEARLHIGYAHPFRDGKGSASWEGGFRVPGIFHWPGTIDPKRELEPASTLDILPTLFKICNVSVPSDRSIDGRDIRPLLSNKLCDDKEVAPFNFIYSYSNNKPSAIRKGPWKLHVRIGSQLRDNYGYKADRNTPLLFHIEEDCAERINRAEDHPELVKEMLTELENHEAQVKQEGNYWDKPKI